MSRGDDTSPLDRAIARVVESGNCSGCGACTLLDDGLAMRLDDGGFARPLRVAPVGNRAADDADATHRFARACPGRRVDAQNPTGSTRHPTMGPVIESWSAWATDPEIRRAGSSGGTLTALAAWLTETGRASRVIGARSDDADVRRTVSVRITSREEALASAGSRYAPASTGAMPGVLDPTGAVVGKPCEVSALRALADDPDPAASATPLLLSFFCAGTPSQFATDRLLAALGVPEQEALVGLRYRGDGWPGDFAARRADGSVARTDYDDSWGAHLGRSLQWRCKVCADGVGESSDITAADLWEADDRGYPVFAEGEGVSALIARTPRGVEVVRAAVEAGVLSVAPLDIGRLAAVQPLQRARRQTLAGRLMGTIAAGGLIPRYRGFGLTRLALPRWRESLRVGRATAARRRAWRRT